MLETAVSEFTRVAREALFLVIALDPEGHKTPEVGLLHETVRPASWWQEQLAAGGWECSATKHVTSRARRLHNAWLDCHRRSG